MGFSVIVIKSHLESIYYPLYLLFLVYLLFHLDLHTSLFLSRFNSGISLQGSICSKSLEPIAWLLKRSTPNTISSQDTKSSNVNPEMIKVCLEILQNVSRIMKLFKTSESIILLLESYSGEIIQQNKLAT